MHTAITKKSTAHTLPPEIVREIFKHSSIPLTISRLYHRPNDPIFPWRFGQICSPWRAVFLSMYEEFWCKCIVKPAIDNPFKSKRIVAMTKTFLERTQGRPFSFEVYVDGTSLSTRIFELLMAESSHWLDAYITIHDAQIPILSAVKNRVKGLRSLALTAYSHSTWAGTMHAAVVPATCNDIFYNAPLLTKITLSSLSTWVVNWSSVTILHLVSGLDNKHLLSILPRMTNLEELSINSMISAIHDGNIPVTVPRLTALKVSELDLLSCLNVPSLEQLCINIVEDDPNWHSSSSICASFFERPSCLLQYLAVKRCMSDTLAAILPCVPELSTLSIDHGVDDLDGDSFRLLACSPGRPPVVPGLQTLRISCINLSDEDLHGLKGVVASRTTTGASGLRRLVIDLWEDQPDIVLETLMDRLEIVKQQCEICDVRFETEFTMETPAFRNDLLYLRRKL